ncbi:hypothetical protein ACOI22_03615 [Glaciecola sp. 2405UD65-10]|uniref:hypothetical protein n=1 Tax=Glaciecola sp. 2405UD65-10 TaxID=3397244 RepID=UPI003B58FF39
MILTPNQYAKKFYEGGVTCATIRNWIKQGRLPVDHVAERTPTGHYIIRVSDSPKTKAQSLAELMKKRA